MIPRMTSFAYTPGARVPVTSMRRTFRGSSARHCDARTSRTCDVPMPNASAPNAPCVDVWLSPHAIVIPGCVRPSSGPITCTMPCSREPRSCSGTPWSRQFCCSDVSISSASASAKGRARLVVGTMWSTVATVDHIVPTTSLARPFADAEAEEMLTSLQQNCRDHGVPLHDLGSLEQGIVHVIGPELGLTQPGMTIACGDSHTSTHGAFGTLAFGIGTTQVRDVLATQCLGLDALKVRRINLNGKLKPGVTAKDVTLYIIQKLGVKGGIGYAYEYGG